MAFDPTYVKSSFRHLMESIEQCKLNRKTCPKLKTRPYYFEPNPVTIEDWNKEGYFIGGLDTRAVFVCESPGPSGNHTLSTKVDRCWANNERDRRFLAARKKYGFHNCYITNTVKCGVREEGKHHSKEIEACSRFLITELELIKPMVVVGVGNNANDYLDRLILPEMPIPPVLFKITHYSMRENPWENWDKEFPNLQRLLARLRPRAEWGF